MEEAAETHVDGQKGWRQLEGATETRPTEGVAETHEDRQKGLKRPLE